MRKLIIALGSVVLLCGAALAQFGGGGTVTNNITAAATNRAICSIRLANFNSTADQACARASGITTWMPTSVIVTNCSASLTLAVGGVYPTTAKGGTALVANTQVYAALTTSSIVLPLTLVAGIATTRYTVSNVYLSLTVAQGSAATCDLYVFGNDLT